MHTKYGRNPKKQDQKNKNRRKNDANVFKNHLN